MLVCDIFELCNYLFFLCLCVLVQKGWILRTTGQIIRTSWPESPGSNPESPGPAVEHSFFWVNIMPYASHLSLHSPVHPTVKHIRAFMVLLIYMPKLLTCQVKFEIQKFMSYIKGELLYARRLLFYDYQMSYMWIVINHQKGGDWKWFRPLSGFWWIMTKHMSIKSCNWACVQVMSLYRWNEWRRTIPQKKGNEKA